MDFEGYLKNRIEFLRQIRKDNNKKLENHSDKLRSIWLKDRDSIQAKLEERELTLQFYQKKQIDVDQIGN